MLSHTPWQGRAKMKLESGAVSTSDKVRNDRYLGLIASGLWMYTKYGRSRYWMIYYIVNPYTGETRQEKQPSTLELLKSEYRLVKLDQYIMVTKQEALDPCELFVAVVSDIRTSVWWWDGGRPGDKTNWSWIRMMSYNVYVFKARILSSLSPDHNGWVAAVQATGQPTLSTGCYGQAKEKITWYLSFWYEIIHFFIQIYLKVSQ